MPHRTALPKICIALGLPSVDKLLAHARHEAESGETFLEFRLDYLTQPQQGIKAITDFLGQFPQCTLIATCRRHQNHGHFNGSIEEQVRILDAAIDAGARAVDIEVESGENIQSKLDAIRGHAWLILSYHNFGGTPSLDAVLRRMLKIPADAYKLVSTARKPSDNYRVLSLAKSHPRSPLVLLAMGETGFPTRVLSTAMGGLYTYASPSSVEGTALGQVSAKMLRNLFRVEKFSRAAKIYGVIGSPVHQSIGPAVHNRAFQSRRMDSVYLPFLVLPPQLKDFFLLADKLPVAGFSVTIPHKQKILRYLDIVEPLARRIGAVNTVFKKGGKWRGLNTDVQGVLVPLSKRIRLAKASVLVAGNGGAARSAAFALAEAGSNVAIVGRNPDRVRALAKACNAEPLMREQVDSRYFDALVHATPLGLIGPQVNECFFPDRIPAEIVFDMVYNPLETVLLKHATEQKKEKIDGLQMFLEQAALQFETWTGETAPRAAMGKAAMEASGQH
ncbi:MAG TPA: shikimate dehydrogenase [Bryobacteraceae bacterium]|nr:shikimate dehydrogenase [Bryobacteraceae bacterium]